MLAGYPADAQTAILVAILATYVTTLAQLVGVTSRIDRKLPAGPRKLHFGLWFAVSMPIFLVESFFFLLTNADVLMVGFYMQPDDVAVYFATVKTLALVHFVYFAVKAGVAQRYAAYHAWRHRRSLPPSPAKPWPGRSGRRCSWRCVVLALGEPMLMLFGPGFEAGYPLLFLLVIGVVARAAVGPCESLLTMSGNQNICAAGLCADAGRQCRCSASR